MVVAAGSGHATMLIWDNFDESQQSAIFPAFGINVPTSIANGAGILGGEREVAVTLDFGSQVSTYVNFGGNSLLSFNLPAASKGDGLITWDGPDGNTSNVNTTGLNGVDLTDGGLYDAVAIAVDFMDLGSNMMLTVWTDANNSSEINLAVPGGVFSGSAVVVWEFANFVPESGTGADFANVGAISLSINAHSETQALDLQLDYIASIAWDDPPMDSLAVQVIPEPTTLLLFALGIIALGLNVVVRNRNWAWRKSAV
jgi:hypothetical protein